MIIGIGNARSGTTTLSETLSIANNADIRHEGEVYPWLHLEKAGFEGKLPDLTGTFPLKWATQSSKQIKGDINYYLSPFITTFYKLDPSTKFILLLRNPANIIRSHVNLGFPLELIKNLKHPTHILWESNRWVPFGDEIPDRFTRICLYWKYTNQKIYQQLKTIPQSSYRTIKLEELDKYLPELWSWCNLQGNLDRAIQEAKIIHNTRSIAIQQEFPTYEYWTDNQKAIYREIVIQSGVYYY